MRAINSLIVLALLTAFGCAHQTQTSSAPTMPQTSKQEKMDIKLTSTAFKEGQAIPRQHSCDGVNISPPLEWSGVPKSAKTITIIVDDPDAPSGTFTHWVLYNLPADKIGLVENTPRTKTLAGGGMQGQNGFDEIGYGGPCPPSGTHRYLFKIYALDAELSVKDNAKKAEVENAMQGHIVAQGQLMGTYSR